MNGLRCLSGRGARRWDGSPERENVTESIERIWLLGRTQARNPLKLVMTSLISLTEGLPRMPRAEGSHAVENAGPRVNDDDSSTETGNDFWIVYPFASGTRCPYCGGTFTIAKGMPGHQCAQRRGARQRFLRGTCATEYRSYQSVSCHHPHCKGEKDDPPAPVDGHFSCERCPRQFPSARGLATHERHCHPPLRNEKRLQSILVPKAHNESGRKDYV
jgi:hypothetical protein